MTEVMVPEFDIEAPGGVGVSITTDDEGTLLTIRLTSEGVIADVYRDGELIATKAQMYDEFADGVIAQEARWHGLIIEKENDNGIC